MYVCSADRTVAVLADTEDKGKQLVMRFCSEAGLSCGDIRCKVLQGCDMNYLFSAYWDINDLGDHIGYLLRLLCFLYPMAKWHFSAYHEIVFQKGISRLYQLAKLTGYDYVFR